MTKKILFSPVGNTDPIKNNRDGAILNICRRHRPDKVYLYLSKEMAKHQAKDQRYTYCLDQLSALLGYPITYELIEDPQMENVQVFDTFVEYFRKLLPEIMEKEGVDQLIVNVSSGTPAMKSALLFLSSLSDRYEAYQVDTPTRRTVDEKNDYAIADVWAANEDNKPDDEQSEQMLTRCHPAGSKNWSGIVKREIIQKHIESYDYVAALQVAEDMDDLDAAFIKFLKAADARLKLDYKKAYTLLKEVGHTDVIPVKNDKIRPLVEYVLSLAIKLKKQEYADFIRALTPLTQDLYKAVIQSELGINVEKDLAVQREQKDRFDNISLGYRYVYNKKKLENHPDINTILYNAYDKPQYNYPVSNDNVYKIIVGALTDDSDAPVVETVRELHNVERRIRNQAAHQIDAVVTAQSIQSKVGMMPEDVMTLIQTLMDQYVIPENQDQVWQSYEKMNGALIEILKA